MYPASYTINVTTVGSAGSAAGAASTPQTIRGYLDAVRITYHASAPATTDVNLTELSGLGRTLLIVADSNTPGVYYPRAFVHNPSGVASTTNVTRYLLVDTQLQVGVAGSNALTNAVVVTLYITGV